MKEKNYPAKTFLSKEDREILLREGGMSLVCGGESQAAEKAGDMDTAWAWLAAAELPAHALKSLKRWYGADFIREKGFDTTKADKELGKNWLEQPDD